jgi:hypothetical protein
VLLRAGSNRSATSRWTVSPRVGSPLRAARRVLHERRQLPEPRAQAARSSSISSRRSAAYSCESSRRAARRRRRSRIPVGERELATSRSGRPRRG